MSPRDAHGGRVVGRAPEVSASDGTRPAVDLRVHATFVGRGAAYDGERMLAEVEYSLKDIAEVPTPLGGAPTAGERNLYGLVRSPGVDVLGGYVGVRLVLQLQDGRLLPFMVVKVLRVDVFLIQGLVDPR